jgi:hypothetical protein
MEKLGMVVVMLAMVAVAIVPALAQDGAGSDTVPAEDPEAPYCGWVSPTNSVDLTGGASSPDDHGPGEKIIVSYDSVEAMWASPQENVNHQFNRWDSYDTETGPVYYPIPIEMQMLYFEDIANIADPCERFAAEEAKRQEILAWPGVKDAGFNGYFYVTPAATAAG